MSIIAILTALQAELAVSHPILGMLLGILISQLSHNGVAANLTPGIDKKFATKFNIKP